MRVLSVFLLGGLFVGSTCAQVAIKGFSLGQDLDEAAATAQMRCSTMQRSSRRLCGNYSKVLPDSIDAIAGVPAQRVYLVGSSDGKVGLIHFGFRSVDFEIVRDALTSKYPDLKCVDSTVQNRMAAAFDQTVCRVSVDSAMIEVQRREGEVTRGGVTAMSLDYMAAMKIEEDAKAVKAKSDF